MQKPSILVVEDDKNIAKLLRYNLDNNGFECTVSGNAEDALEILSRHKIDAVILDVMLPKMDGFEACRIIKQDSRLKNIPVIMLTAKGEEVDRVVGFELGADDYIVKPFSTRELLLRIKAVLRRAAGIKETISEIIEAENIRVDIPRHKVIVNNKDIELTNMEFKLLVTLLKRRGRVQTRETLLQDVWGLYNDVDTRTVDSHIKTLRSHLGRAGGFIKTIRGLGYCFEDEGDSV